MTRNQATHEAQRIHAALERNADDIHFDRMTWETFEARNRALWDKAQVEPRVKEMVPGLLRKDPNWQMPEERPMSKQKIDEVVTEARIARGKRARTVTREVPTEAPEETPAAETQAEEPKPKKGKKAKAQAKPKAEAKESQADLVVFAFRLKPEERDLIHRAAGAAKASRYVRALSIAASRGDEKTVVEIVQAVKAHLASTAS